MNKGILYIISGPSGTGKGTICEELLKRREFYLSVSLTSRPQKKNEIAGVTYNYVTREEFKEKIDKDRMLEWAVYNENYYGTPKDRIEEEINSGKDVILEIEAQGAMQVKAKCPEAVMLFVVPPSMEILRERLKTRGRETDEEIEKRIGAAKWEFSQAEKYNRIIVNDDLNTCVNEVLDIMDKLKQERNFVASLINE